MTAYERAQRIRELADEGALPTMIASRLDVDLRFVKQVITAYQRGKDTREPIGEYVPADQVPSPRRQNTRRWDAIADQVRATPAGMAVRIPLSNPAWRWKRQKPKGLISWAREALKVRGISATVTYDESYLYITPATEAPTQ